MNVKNIKSFVEFYESLGVSTFLTHSQRSQSFQKNLSVQKKGNFSLKKNNNDEKVTT